MRATLLAGIIATFGGLGQTNAQAPSLKESFLEEYRLGVRKLVEHYSHVRIAASHSNRVTLTGTKDVREDRTRLLFRAADPLYSLEYKVEAGLGTAPGTSFVSVAGKQNCFQLEKPPNADGYLMSPFVKTREQTLFGIRNTALFAVAPYSFESGETLSSCLAHPDTTILAREDVVARGRKLVKATYRMRTTKVDFTAWVLFSPQNSWAVLEQGRAPVGGLLEHRMELTYETLEAEIPRLKELRIVQKDSSGQGERLWRVLSFVPGRIPEAEFTPKFYEKLVQ